MFCKQKSIYLDAYTKYYVCIYLPKQKAKWSTYIFANKVIKYFFVAMEISALGSFKATPCVKVQQLYLR